MIPYTRLFYTLFVCRVSMLYHCTDACLTAVFGAGDAIAGSDDRHDRRHTDVREDVLKGAEGKSSSYVSCFPSLSFVIFVFRGDLKSFSFLFFFFFLAFLDTTFVIAIV